jgi:membrane protein
VSRFDRGSRGIFDAAVIVNTDAVGWLAREAALPGSGDLRSHWVVIQLKDALNIVWEVDETPGHGIWHFIQLLVSLAAVLALGFLLLGNCS